MAPAGRRGRVVTPERGAVLDLLASRVPRRDRPVLVVVDGADAAGKTVLADQLARLLPTSVRASLDDFHHSRAHRHALGRTGDTVWGRSFDYAAVRRELLDPWRRGVGAAYRRRRHDLATDSLVEDMRSPVPAGGVLVVDGVFAQRPELGDAWDLVVYLDVPDAVRIARMALRDGLSEDRDDPDQATVPRRSADLPRGLSPTRRGGRRRRQRRPGPTDRRARRRRLAERPSAVAVPWNHGARDR